MGTGQSLLTLAAMMMLTMMSVNVNTSTLQTQDVMQNSKFGVTAISLATSLIQDASKEAFDENTLAATVSNTGGLTNANSLRAESGETTKILFDDFDDFNGFTQRDTTLTSAVYNISCVVDYVSATSPNVRSSSATWHKRMIVSITSPSMKDTVRVTAYTSYWKFR